jgi:hypothetical protein
MEGYSDAQKKKMAEIMYDLREWFGCSIIIVKDNRKPIYFEQDCDEDLIYPLLESAYHGMCEPEDEEEWVEWEGPLDEEEWD